MATWYWVAAAPANFATANWATSSGGTASGQPAAGDIAIFDSKSSQTCTIAANTPALLSFDCQGGVGPFTGTITHSAGVSIIIGTGGGVFRLAPLPMTYSPAALTSVVLFQHTSGICAITSAGRGFNAITQSGAGGTVQQQDDILVVAISNAVFTLTAGTWDCNGRALNTILFSSSNSNVRTFNAGSGLVLGGFITTNQTLWNVATATNFTFNKNALPNITIIAMGSAQNGMYISGMPASLNLPGLVFNTTIYQTQVQFTAGGNFPSLTVNGGWTITAPQTGGTITCPNVVFNGVAGNPCAFYCIATSSTIQLTCTGSFSATYTAIGFVTVSGTPAGAAVANNCFQFGITSGILFTGTLLPSGNIASAIWQDLLSSSDFTTPGSAGALLAALGNLQFTAADIGRGTVAAGATTTSIPTSAMTPAGAAANQFANGVIIFDANTATAALRSQRALISASSNAANPTLTVGALTTAPASGDTFSVL